MDGKEAAAVAAPLRPEFDVYDENTGQVDHVASTSRDAQEKQQEQEQQDHNHGKGSDGIPSARDSELQRDGDEFNPRRFPTESDHQITTAGSPDVGVDDHDEEEQGDDGASRQTSRGPRPPSVNCGEKIIICIDLASEVNNVPFLQRDGTKHLPIELVKRALSLFVRTKSTINPRHQFALVVLQETAVWLQDFTSDVEEFLNVMFDLTNETQECESCDLTSLFETIASKVDLPEIDDVEVLPPPYIIRTLFFYGRSASVPEFSNGREAQLALSNSPYFFFDVFYLHEPPSEENCCKDIYDVFLELDKNSTSYIHEVGRNTTHLYNKMASLVSHPLQRPEQIWSSYSLDGEQ